MADQQFTNLAQSTLASGYTAADTTITVQTGEGALFPSAGDFTVAIADPPEFFLKCTSRAGDVLTVSTTGQEGSTATNQASSTKVTHVVTAGVLRSLMSDYLRTDAIASLPAASKAGRIFFPTDSYYNMLRDTGSAWEYFRDGKKLTPPVDANFAWINQGTATSTQQTNGGVVLAMTSNAGYNWRIRKKAIPSAPYTVTIGYHWQSNGPGEEYAGLLLRESGSGKLVSWTPGWNLSGMSVAAWNSPTSFNSASLSTASMQGSYSQTQWLRIVDDNTNRIFQISVDGVNFLTILSQSRTTFITPDEIGFGINNNNTKHHLMTVIHYKEQ